MNRTESSLACTTAMLRAFMAELGIDPAVSTVTITLPDGTSQTLNAGEVIKEAQEVLDI
jgi:nicotinamide mononucleotide (NMN) deamidase PncC